MGGRARVVVGSVVLDHPEVVDRGLTEPHQTWRSEPVVQVLVPLVAQQARLDNSLLSVLEPGYPSVPPESVSGEPGGNLQSVVSPGIHREDGSCQTVLGLSTEWVDGSSVPPGSRPLIQHWVDLDFLLGLLVDDHVTVVVLPPHSPEHLVPTEESEVETPAGVPSQLYVPSLLAAPILVVAN